MPSGPEHYREAEKALAFAASADNGSGLEHYHFAAAQVHATLALAAATALTKSLPTGEFYGAEFDAWHAVAGVQRDQETATAAGRPA